MTAQGAQRLILGAWVAMIGMATVRRLTDPATPGLPPPSVFVGSGVLFTLLFGVAGFAPSFAAAIAVGVDVGALLNPYLKGQPALSPLTRLTGFLDGVAGVQPPLPATQTQTGAGTLRPGRPS